MIVPVIDDAASLARKVASRGDFLDLDELLGRLRVQQHVADHLGLGDAACLRRIGNLFFDERRPHVARADRVHR
jgi:hypothetical protein